MQRTPAQQMVDVMWRWLGLDVPERKPAPSSLSKATRARWRQALTEGQYRAIEAWVGQEFALPYWRAAIRAGMTVNTLKTHLRRARQRAPDVWLEVVQRRRAQLAKRHEQALKRDAAHSRKWHRRQANRHYLYRFGRWPWE